MLSAQFNEPNGKSDFLMIDDDDDFVSYLQSMPSSAVTVIECKISEYRDIIHKISSADGCKEELSIPMETARVLFASWYLLESCISPGKPAGGVICAHMQF